MSHSFIARQLDSDQTLFTCSTAINELASQLKCRHDITPKKWLPMHGITAASH